MNVITYNLHMAQAILLMLEPTWIIENTPPSQHTILTIKILTRSSRSGLNAKPFCSSKEDRTARILRRRWLICQFVVAIQKWGIALILPVWVYFKVLHLRPLPSKLQSQQSRFNPQSNVNCLWWSDVLQYLSLNPH